MSKKLLKNLCTEILETIKHLSKSQQIQIINTFKDHFPKKRKYTKSGWQVFLKEHRVVLKEQGLIQNKTFGEITQILAMVWRSLNEVIKQDWKNKALGKNSEPLELRLSETLTQTQIYDSQATIQIDLTDDEEEDY